MDSESLSKFLATVRRTRFIDYLDPIGVTPQQALEQRLRWAARSRKDPRHAAEAAFLLENADALRQLVEREIAAGGGSRRSGRARDWMRRSGGPKPPPPTKGVPGERPPLLTRMEDITPPPMDSGEVRDAVAAAGGRGGPPRPSSAFGPVDDDADADSTVRIAGGGFDALDDEDDQDRLATVRMSSAGFDALDDEDDQDSMATVRISSAGFDALDDEDDQDSMATVRMSSAGFEGLEDEDDQDSMATVRTSSSEFGLEDPGRRERRRPLATPTPSMMQRKGRPPEAAEPKKGRGRWIWALLALVVLGALALAAVVLVYQGLPRGGTTTVTPAATEPAPAPPATTAEPAPVAAPAAKPAPAPVTEPEPVVEPAPVPVVTPAPAPVAKPAPAPAPRQGLPAAPPAAQTRAGPPPGAPDLAGTWDGTVGDGKIHLHLAAAGSGWAGTAVVEMGGQKHHLKVHATWEDDKAVLDGRQGALFTGFMTEKGGNGTVVFDSQPIAWTIP